jgi:hypothetical protein
MGPRENRRRGEAGKGVWSVAAMMPHIDGGNACRHRNGNRWRAGRWKNRAKAGSMEAYADLEGSVPQIRPRFSDPFGFHFSDPFRP